MTDQKPKDVSAHMPPMTLRDWFAGQVLAAGIHYDTNQDFPQKAQWAYRMADAFMAERSKRQRQQEGGQ